MPANPTPPLRETRRRLGWVLVFTVAMALFETAVATDLWRLWEIGEFDLSASPFSSRLLATEALREAASIVMIVAVAVLAGRGALERLGYASLVFGLWDLLYYFFLRLITGWPPSVLSWDVLFLIPHPWIGPVLAPALVAAALVVGGALVLVREDRAARGVSSPLAPGAWSWLAAVAGGAIVIASFLTVEVPSTRTGPAAGFSWTLFLIGYGLAILGFVLTVRRSGGAGARRPLDRDPDRELVS